MEKEGEKHQCVVASRVSPSGDLAHNPGMFVPWLGIEPVTLWFPGQHSIPWAKPARAHCLDIAQVGYPFSVDGHLGYFCFPAVMNNTNMSVHVHIFVWIYIFKSLGKYLGVELLGYVWNFKSLLKRTVCVQSWLSSSYKSGVTANFLAILWCSTHVESI